MRESIFHTFVFLLKKNIGSKWAYNKRKFEQRDKNSGNNKWWNIFKKILLENTARLKWCHKLSNKSEKAFRNWL